jgi:1-acyl-sn-glycerol-3-phosphate acyltransferase
VASNCSTFSSLFVCSYCIMKYVFVGSDASRSAVDQALSKGDRIGIVPGGIAEIFEGYPKRGTKPDDEYSIVRKGFLQLAQRHGIPVIPIYCFGATKMFRRWNLPLLDQLSSYIRASIVIFYGLWGLPIPFRQKLLYVVGNPIDPIAIGIDHPQSESDIVNVLHQQFCDELHRIFNRHKEAYGWENKSLHILSR